MFRYIGNKAKLLPYIINATNELIGSTGTVIDLMAGTGTVSSEFKRRGYNVIASDIMTYSKFHLITQLKISEAPLFSNLDIQGGTFPYNSILNYLNSLEPIDGYFYTEFSPEGIPQNGCESRKYFTSENAKKIDAIRIKLNEWIDKELLTEEEEALLKHTLIMAVNRVANISGTYGYYMSEFRKNALEPLLLSPIEFIPGNTENNKVYQGFAEDLASILEGDICYIDPPYMKRQYAANYHILETIARGDFPEAVGKSGLRDWWDQHSKFCTKTKGLDSFEKVISEMQCEKFIISYSEDGLFSLDQMRSTLEKYGEVEVEFINYNRFRSNQSKLPKLLKEYIIKLKKV